ncbi:hypothetical protein [Erythrobacter sp. F6033]|uniref:hypothetical protein n=1 Tax=Erythrobacter sp. F6033 TaxID=2926401 RepID=UPI001FF4E46F|nr:hypothetical protein [Erythrobacter sp. F6033]MCK0127848.1 hypothetical protein [Erythrobacter sp. F6033]
MRKMIAPLAAAAMLTACGSDNSETVSADEGEYSIDAESGETTATVQTEDGTATFRSGADVPVDLPPGFSLYPGATVTSNSRFEQEGGGGQVVLLSFESEDSSEQIAQFYRDAASEAGFKIAVDASMNGGQLITGESKNGGVFTLSTSAEEGKTLAQLTTGLGEITP